MWQGRPPWMQKKKESKYRNRTSTGLDGRKYHSGLEASVSNWLLAQEKAGEISIIKRQQHIHLFSLDVKLCEYWPDFTILDKRTQEIYWVEAKGAEKPEWAIKLNLWRAGGPGRLDIIKGRWSSPRLVESVTPVQVGLHTREDQVFGKIR